MSLFLYIGIGFALLGVCMLTYMGMTARKLNLIEPEQRDKLVKKLIALNFGGLALGVLGLMLIIMSRVL